MTGLRVRLVSILLAFGASPAAADQTVLQNDACDCTVVPALTPVTIEIGTPLGSKLSKSGDTFPIRLVEPIMIAGQVVVAAGEMGIGEVVHAKKSGGMGAPGELVLAARYLEVGGQRLALRSFNFAANGKSNIGAVDGMAIASAASPIPISVIGFFIRGGQVTISPGTVAQAKTRENFVVPAPSSTVTDRASAGSSSTGEERE